MTILIWGTGDNATQLLHRLSPAVQISAFIETIPSKESFGQRPVISPGQIADYPHDLVVVASIYALAIRELCLKQVISTDKFIYLFMDAQLNIVPDRLDQLQSLIDPEAYVVYKDGFKNRYAPVMRMAADEGEQPSYFDRWDVMGEYLHDYTRYRTLELLCALLKDRGVPGSVAEAGVFRGDFARAINYLMPDRTCHLFDTFESFDPAEFQTELAKKRVLKQTFEGFTHTTTQLVLSKLPHPHKCVIHQGFFPQTAVGLEDSFSFVSLDMDLENSIYDGLCYFYPRLSPGGYIMVHDYSHRLYHGVQEAIKRYEEQVGRLALCPISDQGGTLIICKPS